MLCWGTLGVFACVGRSSPLLLGLPKVVVSDTRGAIMQSEQDDQAVVEASNVAEQMLANGNQAQQPGDKPQADAPREAPPPPAEKDSKPKDDGSLTEKEGRATGAP